MLNADELSRSEGPAYSAMSERSLRSTKLELVDAKAKPGRATLGIPGSMTLYLARAGTRSLEQVRKAISSDGPAATKLLTKVVRQVKSRETVSVDEAVQKMVREPVFAELRYGGIKLADGLYVPKGLDLLVLVFPYNGGRLARGGFTLTEYYKDGRDAALEGLVVQSKPVLTVAERKALTSVPTDQLEHNVGFAADCDSTWWAVIGLVAAAATLVLGTTGEAALAAAAVAGGAGEGAAVGAAEAALAEIWGAASFIQKSHLTDAQIKKLGPAASARRLVQIRREAFGMKGKKKGKK